jgi:hypothetical protein
MAGASWPESMSSRSAIRSLTSAPSALAIWTAKVPTPPDAPMIRTCCPAWTRPWSRTAWRAATNPARRMGYGRPALRCHVPRSTLAACTRTSTRQTRPGRSPSSAPDGWSSSAVPSLRSSGCARHRDPPRPRRVDAKDALVALLPLLERQPEDALGRVRSLDGPPFPWLAVVAAALSGESAYWHEQGVPWLGALHAEPRGQLADAARHALRHGRASQRHRQQLHRWLTNKPIRGL